MAKQEQIPEPEREMTIEEKLAQARNEGIEEGRRQIHEEIEREKQEFKEVSKGRKERDERQRQFLAEIGIVRSVEDFFKKCQEAGLDPKAVWFGNMGETKVQVEDPSGHESSYNSFEHAFVRNSGDVDACAEEAKKMLRHDGWDKYYLCASEDLTKDLVSKVPVEQVLKSK